MTIEIGDKIPSFTAEDQNEYPVTQKDLLGAFIVLYFYPKDETPGCTKEACSFAQSIKAFDEKQAVIIGISPDSVSSHKKFIKNRELNFSLLSDPEKKMCEAFGVIKDGKLVRSTFIIDDHGKVVWKEQPVSVSEHTDRVLKALDQYCQKPVLPKDTFERQYAKLLKESLKAKD